MVIDIAIIKEVLDKLRDVKVDGTVNISNLDVLGIAALNIGMAGVVLYFSTRRLKQDFDEKTTIHNSQNLRIVEPDNKKKTHK